jgi:hypothetical protein
MTPNQKKTFYRKNRLVKPHGPHKRWWMHWWMNTFFGIHIPNVKVCADHDAPFTAFADAFFNESSKGMSKNAYVCHGSRALGSLSSYMSLLSYSYCGEPFLQTLGMHW